MRVEASAEGRPGSVLIGLPEGCDLERLRALVEERLGVAPEQLYVGQAELVDVADLRDGDKLTVAWAPPPGGPEPCSLLQREPTQPRWYQAVHALLTLIIFVLLSELFQRFIFLPWFHPKAEDDAHPAWGARSTPPWVAHGVGRGEP